MNESSFLTWMGSRQFCAVTTRRARRNPDEHKIEKTKVCFQPHTTTRNGVEIRQNLSRCFTHRALRRRSDFLGLFPTAHGLLASRPLSPYFSHHAKYSGDGRRRLYRLEFDARTAGKAPQGTNH